MGYHPAFGALPAPAQPIVDYLPIPEGDAGLAWTLARIAANIQGWNPLTDQLALAFPTDPGFTETETAAEIFYWVKRHLIYMDEVFSYASEVSDSIATPDAIVSQILYAGKAYGDCAHYTSLLGALYVRHGWPVTLIWVKTAHPQKGIQDHVFPTVETDEGVFAADGIIRDWQFGDEIPPEERLSQVEVPV